MSIFSRPLRHILLSVLIFAPLALCTDAAFAKKKTKTKPASQEEIYLYRGLGASYLCNARSAGVDFPKAVGIAASTYTQVLNGRHGGFVASAGKKKLTNKQLFSGAEFQIVTGALQFCPKQVPDDVKAKVKAVMNKND